MLPVAVMEGLNVDRIAPQEVRGITNCQVSVFLVI